MVKGNRRSCFHRQAHIFIVLLIFLNSSDSKAINKKFENWTKPGYFKGYNILPPKTQQDFTDLKKYGANLAQVNIWGFMGTDKPYSTIQSNIDTTDKFIKYCNEAGLYFTLAVRSGPGAYDVYQEMKGETDESRIWDEDNPEERMLYAEMLRQIISRYSKDTLFIGINIMVEPRPKVKITPANNSGLYKRFLENIYDIHMNKVYEYFVKEIRKTDKEIPIIIENFAFSNPELFPPYIIDDPYIVYDAHMYVPYEFTTAEISYSQIYPGNYKNISKISSEYYNKNFLKETVFGKLREFQLKTKSPVFIGEFGIKNPQDGGEQYLKDVLDISKEYGWHFAMWEWRGSNQRWNVEKFEDRGYFETVLKYLK